MTVYTLKYHQGPTSCTVTPFSLRPKRNHLLPKFWNFAHIPATYFHEMFSFNSGNFEKCVTLLRDKHKSKDLAPVVQSIFSHESVVKKNQLTIKLIVSTKFNLY